MASVEGVEVSLPVEFEGSDFKCGKKQVKIRTHEGSLIIGEETHRFRDIVCCEAKETKDSRTQSLVLHYIHQRKPKEKKLFKKCKTVTGSVGDCQSLQRVVQQGLDRESGLCVDNIWWGGIEYTPPIPGSYATAVIGDEAPVRFLTIGKLQPVDGRPKKLYVIINPISGPGKGVKIFREKVEPLFKLAGIESNVIVTDRGGGQCVELLKAEDLSKYDGIVVCGGDGMYFELVNGVLHNFQKEHGVDVENPECDLVKFPIPLSVIPTGTGNRIAHSFTSMEIVTVALAIIRGETKPSNVETIYNNNKFLTYNGFFVCHGYYSDLMHTAEKNKAHGLFSRLTTIFRFMLKKPRTFQGEVEFLPADEQNPANRFELETAEGEKPGWKKLEMEIMSVDNYIGLFVRDENNKWDFDYGTNKTAFMIQTFANQWANMKVVAAMGTLNFDMSVHRHIHQIYVKAFKVKMKYDYPEVVDEDEYPSIEESLNIDGEVVRLKTPDYEVRMHQHIVKLFSVC